MAPDTSAAEDGLVRHQWQERLLVMERLYAIMYKNTRTGKQGKVNWERGDGLWDFQGRGEPGKGTTFEM